MPPANSLLANRLAKKQGISVMTNWKKDLNSFLDKFGSALIKRAKMKKV
jgi:hypothetical protein